MDYIELARSKAEKYGLDPGIFERMIRQESQFNPDAVSERGAQGIAQIMPKTGKKPGYGVTPIDDPFDADTSLEFAAQYMAAMLRKYDGDYGLALSAYNAGPGATDEAGGVAQNKETLGYLTKIMPSDEIPENYITTPDARAQVLASLDNPTAEDPRLEALRKLLSGKDKREGLLSLSMGQMQEAVNPSRGGITEVPEMEKGSTSNWADILGLSKFWGK
jgi:hypothetical protein